MARQNTRNATAATRTFRSAAAARGPISTETVATGTTGNGAPGYLYEPHSQLFLLAVTNMVGEQTFYEDASDRDARFNSLVERIAFIDPDFIVRMTPWLRNEANMRTASVVMAAEYAHKMLEVSKAPVTQQLKLSNPSKTIRQVVDSSMSRADEPGEFLAYWIARFGRSIPKPVKRGVADAAVRLYTEFSALKYDTASHGVRFGDVIELTHPKAKAPWQSDLFRFLLDRRHGRDEVVPDSLSMTTMRRYLESIPVEERRHIVTGVSSRLPTEALQQGGMTWESLSGWLQGPMDAAAWEAVIPSMGYMALLRNLRNFDQTGVSDEVAERIAKKLMDPEEVAKSRQLPMRFLSAYNAAPSDRWKYPLGKALDLALSNVPVLQGRTLILVDTSGSMAAPFSRDGSLMRWDAAVVFALAQARRCEKVDVVSYAGSGWYSYQNSADDSKVFQLRKGAALLGEVARWKNDGYFIGGGTDTAGAVSRHFAGHDRIVLLTDEQANAHGAQGVFAPVPDTTPTYTFNLAGYARGHDVSGTATRHTVGGLSDAGFKMIALIEQQKGNSFPF